MSTPTGLAWNQKYWNAACVAASEIRKTNEVGPVGERLGLNVKALRAERSKMSTYELSDKLGELGRPIQASGITKIENGGRRVDVGDLVALALALKTTPNRLLLTAAADTETVQLTPTTAMAAADAWDWAKGEAPDAVGVSITTALARKMVQLREIWQLASQLADELGDTWENVLEAAKIVPFFEVGHGPTKGDNDDG